jgi:glycine cleavage system H protein
MSDIPNNFKYTRTHEWISVGDDGIATVGITDHAQELLGDLVYIELPEAETTFDAGDACAVVESVKAASDVYAPLSGEIVEVNEALADTPELVNQDAFGEGWLYRIKLADANESGDLMDADTYAAFAAEEA